MFTFKLISPRIGPIRLGFAPKPSEFDEITLKSIFTIGQSAKVK
jgi:hypothetical protein